MENFLDMVHNKKGEWVYRDTKRTEGKGKEEADEDKDEGDEELDQLE